MNPGAAMWSRPQLGKGHSRAIEPAARGTLHFQQRAKAVSLKAGVDKAIAGLGDDSPVEHVLVVLRLPDPDLADDAFPLP
jgi:hypothetical protein